MAHESAVVQKNIDDGRPLGIVFKYYNVATDMMVLVQAFIEPADLSVFQKYFEMEKIVDFRDANA